jgi:leucyl-tRNA synthetase
MEGPVVEQYGADTARVFILFIGPPEMDVEWSDKGVEGAYRFLRRLWKFAAGFGDAPPSSSKDARFEIHSVLKQATYDLQKHQFNTVASAGMKILNALERLPAGRGPTAEEGLSILLRLLSPITPHVTHHLWRELKFGEDIMGEKWPEPDPAALEQDEVELVVQVNGKLRGSIRVPKAAGRSEIEELARANPNVQRFVAGQDVKKVVVVPGRLVNLVV